MRSRYLKEGMSVEANRVAGTAQNDSRGRTIGIVAAAMRRAVSGGRTGMHVVHWVATFTSDLKIVGYIC